MRNEIPKAALTVVIPSIARWLWGRYQPRRIENQKAELRTRITGLRSFVRELESMPEAEAVLTEANAELSQTLQEYVALTHRPLKRKGPEGRAWWRRWLLFYTPGNSRVWKYQLAFWFITVWLILGFATSIQDGSTARDELVAGIVFAVLIVLAIRWLAVERERTLTTPGVDRPSYRKLRGVWARWLLLFPPNGPIALAAHIAYYLVLLLVATGVVTLIQEGGRDEDTFLGLLAVAAGGLAVRVVAVNHDMRRLAGEYPTTAVESLREPIRWAAVARWASVVTLAMTVLNFLLDKDGNWAFVHLTQNVPQKLIYVTIAGLALYIAWRWRKAMDTPGIAWPWGIFTAAAIAAVACCADSLYSTIRGKEATLEYWDVTLLLTLVSFGWARSLSRNAQSASNTASAS